jgi:hypothetical protein
MRIALRYDGFASAAPNIRRFAFHWDPVREDCQRVSVDADLNHFEKYHVGVQEGPALCIRKIVMEAVSGVVWAPHTDLHLDLLEEEISGFAEARLAARRKRGHSPPRRHYKEIARREPQPKTAEHALLA